MIQRENTETLQAGKAGRERFSRSHEGGVSVLALVVENWPGGSCGPAETLPKCLDCRQGFEWGCGQSPGVGAGAHLDTPLQISGAPFGLERHQQQMHSSCFKKGKSK